jgi:hypothetical protein
MDAQGRQFSTERLIGHLLQTCRQPLTESLAELRSRLQGWRRGEHFDDDVSMIAIEFQPAPAHGSNLIDMHNNAVYPGVIHCLSS